MPGRHSFLSHHSHPTHHYFPAAPTAGCADHLKIHRMRRALDSSDIDLILENALAVHYAVQNCSHDVLKALLEFGATDVNCLVGPVGNTPLHIVAEMVNPDIDGVSPFDILRNLTSDFLFKEAVPGLSHIEPNKLRQCLKLVQSAVMVLSREQEVAAAATTASTTGGRARGGSNLNIALYQ
uniref:BTB/POZ domain and ankyrin repeat-containing protein NPR5-like n=1 Tax=Elaeis guineensis var. tenera TaxID=51953 RepID=A0A6I9QL45_ELAGV|nr:BTB/POZ domain and ankyrin repeat-containing protein NPR5-like [Elaeis guineensis]